jgi:hypothetical protein
MADRSAWEWTEAEITRPIRGRAEFAGRAVAVLAPEIS